MIYWYVVDEGSFESEGGLLPISKAERVERVKSRSGGRGRDDVEVRNSRSVEEGN